MAIDIKRLIDPIAFDLVKVGFSSYLSHIKIYGVMIVSFVFIFGFITGLFYNLKMVNDQLYIASMEKINIIPSEIQYIILGLIVSISAYYIAFRRTLMSGELGMVFNLEFGKKEQLFHAIIYSSIILAYFLVWTAILKAIFILIPGMYEENQAVKTSFSIFLLAIFLIVGFGYLLFLLATWYSYIIFMLDEGNVPSQAMRPLLFITGLFFAVIIAVSEIISTFFQIELFNQITIILTYLIPGIIILPVIAYAMAHLKIASTIIGYEEIFLRSKEESQNLN